MSNAEASNLVAQQYALASILHQITMASRCLKRRKPDRLARAVERLRVARAMARESIDGIEEILNDATPYDARRTA